MDKKITGIWLEGETKSKGNWIDWYLDMADVIRWLGYEPTLIDCEFEDYHPNGWLTIARKEKAILRRLEEGDVPLALSIGYRENKDSDTLVEAWRHNYKHSKEIVFLMDTSKCRKINPEHIARIMQKYIDVEYGEIFSLYSAWGAVTYMVNRYSDLKLGRKRDRKTEILKVYGEEAYVAQSE